MNFTLNESMKKYKNNKEEREDIKSFGKIFYNKNKDQ